MGIYKVAWGDLLLTVAVMKSEWKIKEFHIGLITVNHTI